MTPQKINNNNYGHAFSFCTNVFFSHELEKNKVNMKKITTFAFKYLQLFLTVIWCFQYYLWYTIVFLTVYDAGNSLWYTIVFLTV